MTGKYVHPLAQLGVPDVGDGIVLLVHGGSMVIGMNGPPPLKDGSVPVVIGGSVPVVIGGSVPVVIGGSVPIVIGGSVPVVKDGFVLFFDVPVENLKKLGKRKVKYFDFAKIR